MKRLTTATIVCATLLGGGMCSLCAETGEGASAGERNVWTLAGGVLSKEDWQFPANWDGERKFLNVTGYTAGSGVLDWNGFVLSMGSQMISDLNVVVRGSAFANNAPPHPRRSADARRRLPCEGSIRIIRSGLLLFYGCPRATQASERVWEGLAVVRR